MLLAGKVRGAAEQAYFEEEVRPLLGGGIEYVGEIDLQERVRLLHGARALVNPLAWDEPFGLVMVEAMACGVPVIATPRGSVPEIVSTGVTAGSRGAVDEMAAAVERCGGDRPTRMPAVAERNYSPERMVGGLRGCVRRRHRARRQGDSPARSAHDCLNTFRRRDPGRTGRSCHRRKGLMIPLLLILVLLASCSAGSSSSR